MLSVLKRVLVGRPMSSSQQDEQRLPKTIALATFSSDPISSTAYATEEILFVTAAGTSSLALGLHTLVPIATVVAVLLVIVVTSYRQTLFAYPNGGGSYIVSRENLGEYPSLVAGASLLVDYILTVAVSVSAGVAAIISMPAFRTLAPHRVVLCLGFVALITVANLRGIKESGRIFAVPTYIYIASLAGLVLVGLGVEFLGGGVDPIPFDPAEAGGITAAGGTLGLFLILRGFSSGAVALSGVEAISNGVPAFRRPESRNAATTMTWMAVTLGVLFFGVSVLASHLHPFPSHEETVISQMARAVFGEGPYYVVLQFATAAILVLAANTAYADFPRLSSIIAHDGYLPRQFGNTGDRLVFSNGILFLAASAGALIIAFGGLTNALIPLYAIGVFTSFTLSQAGMVQHHRRLREPGWRRGAVISGIGAIATAAVTLVVGVTKFAIGAWIPIVVVPLIIALFVGIHRHYRRVEGLLTLPPAGAALEPVSHLMVVIVGAVDRALLRALDYARSVRPERLVAVHVAFDFEEGRAIERQWEEFHLDVPLIVLISPERQLVEPIMRFIADMEAESDTVTVVLPEVVDGHWYSQLMGSEGSLLLKARLLFREDTVVTSVPTNGAPAKKG